MDCQLMEWLTAGTAPTIFQYALIGIGCLLAFDALHRRQMGKKVATFANHSSSRHASDLAADVYRKAA